MGWAMQRASGFLCHVFRPLPCGTGNPVPKVHRGRVPFLRGHLRNEAVSWRANSIVNVKSATTEVRWRDVLLSLNCASDTDSCASQGLTNWVERAQATEAASAAGKP